jgi:hypothetical protein
MIDEASFLADKAPEISSSLLDTLHGLKADRDLCCLHSIALVGVESVISMKVSISLKTSLKSPITFCVSTHSLSIMVTHPLHCVEINLNGYITSIPTIVTTTSEMTDQTENPSNADDFTSFKAAATQWVSLPPADGSNT